MFIIFYCYIFLFLNFKYGIQINRLKIKMKPYKLMTSLFAHTGDVKGLCATRDNGGFVSVSRDLSAKMWKADNR